MRRRSVCSASVGRAVLTLIFLLLSAAAFMARYIISIYIPHDKTLEYVPSAAVISEDNCNEPSDKLTAGSNILRDPTVTIRQGRAFVRFNVEIYDSSGVPFQERLDKQQQAIDDYKEKIDPELPSYMAFMEAYHDLKSDYNKLYAKGTLAISTICRDSKYNPERAETLSIPSTIAFTADQLEHISETGDISFIADEDAGGDFIQLYDENDPFSRQYIYKYPLTENESCTLFTNIIIPSDWDTEQTELLVYQKNQETETFEELTLGFTNMSLIGDGFTVKVSADIVDAADFDNPLAAFNTAESLNAVTELSDSSQ